MSDTPDNRSKHPPPVGGAASAPPTLRANVPPIAVDPGVPRRCPKCYFLLSGLPNDGTCPECGTSYTIATSQAYGREVGFVRSVLRWWWPLAAALVLSTLFVVGDRVVPSSVRRLANNSAPPLYILLAVAGLVNGCVQAYFFLRRRHLRKPDVVDLRSNAGLVLGSLGCGTLVFAVSFVVAAGASCVMMLTM